MKFEHVSFNQKFWASKTEAEFIAHESHHGLSEKQLKEAFAFMKPSAPAPIVLANSPLAIVKVDGVEIKAVKQVAKKSITKAQLKKGTS